jgi:hypothetical protein
MKTVMLLVCVLASGCSVLEPKILPESAFTPGDKVVAYRFTAHPQFEGELVTVVEGLAWRRCKNWIYTPVYVVKAGDLILAAQPYQLKKVTQ